MIKVSLILGSGDCVKELIGGLIPIGPILSWGGTIVSAAIRSTSA
jgi:hypothetical protein